MFDSTGKTQPRDHGGQLETAFALYGGLPEDWIDLSTGINPVPYPIIPFSADDFQRLPSTSAHNNLIAAAREFWSIPNTAHVVATAGASAAIAALPSLLPPSQVAIPHPTYNEHQAAFTAAGWRVSDSAQAVQVVVHPNNPDGRLWRAKELTRPVCIIDESFCDVAPQDSLIAEAGKPGRIILKSFGKFWGLAGLRLGFAIGSDPVLEQLENRLGPWAVSGPALRMGAAALSDPTWAQNTRRRLQADAARLDKLMLAKGAKLRGGCSLFRLYELRDAKAWQAKLGQHHIWSRIFPYSKSFLRLGLPAQSHWARIEKALS